MRPGSLSGLSSWLWLLSHVPVDCVRGIWVLAALTRPVDFSPGISVSLALCPSYSLGRGDEVLLISAACMLPLADEGVGWNVKLAVSPHGVRDLCFSELPTSLLTAWPKKDGRLPSFLGFNFVLSVFKDSKWWRPLFAPVAPGRVSDSLQGFFGFYKVSHVSFSFPPGK